jgi:pimeloyl-ACP methyl ester carboxylesterase
MTAQLGVVDRVIRAHRPSMVIGSSLGGYLAALYGARHPDLAPVVVMLAPAFDFVRQWTRKLGPEALRKWRQTGKLSVYHHGQQRMENLGYEFYTDAIRYEAWPKLRQPALIFHGQYDDVVYPSSSVQYVWSNMSAEMELVESGHELTDVLDEIWPKMLQFYRRAEPF